MTQGDLALLKVPSPAFSSACLDAIVARLMSCLGASVEDKATRNGEDGEELLPIAESSRRKQISSQGGWQQ